MGSQSLPTDLTPVADAAQRIGVSVDTVRRWVKSGAVRGWRVGPTAWGMKRRLMVSLSELLAVAVEPVIPKGESCSEGP